MGNVGDSRAVLGSRDKNVGLFAEQLTVDLKPNLPGLYLPPNMLFVLTVDNYLGALDLQIMFQLSW